MPDSKQTGRVIMVTGAGGGVGAALVRRFLDNGDTVIGTDVSADALHTLESDLTAGPALVTRPGDITNPEDANALAEMVREQDRLDILINCAASPDADFVTGQTLNVDGGMFMN